MRTFYTKLKYLQLARKSIKISSSDVLRDVGDFIRQKGDSPGYRNIKERLMHEGKQYSANIIRLALKELDPEGVEMRRNQRLKRRKYINSGQNEVWHIIKTVRLWCSWNH